MNKDFAQVEQIKKFRLIDILLTAEDDELTPTMKLKRSFVETKHKPLIDSMYEANDLVSVFTRENQMKKLLASVAALAMLSAPSAVRTSRAFPTRKS